MKENQTLGEAVDALHALQASIRAEQKASDEKLLVLKQRERELEQYILLALQKDKLTGTRGMKAQVSISPKTVPVVDDWLQVYQFIGGHTAFHLLQKRLASTAWKEFIEAGEVIPGVRSETFSSLHVTKIS